MKLIGVKPEEKMCIHHVIITCHLISDVAPSTSSFTARPAKSRHLQPRSVSFYHRTAELQNLPLNVYRIFEGRARAFLSTPKACTSTIRSLVLFTLFYNSIPPCSRQPASSICGPSESYRPRHHFSMHHNRLFI